MLPNDHSERVNYTFGPKSTILRLRMVLRYQSESADASVAEP